MDSSTLFFFSSFFTYTSLCAAICNPFSCGDVRVRFPFRITAARLDRCGYPGFDLSCNNRSQTVLTLPSSGDYIVTTINYFTQQIYIDPNFCLPGRIQSFTLSGSPFTGDYIRNYTLYNCSLPMPSRMYPAVRLACLEGENYTVVAVDNSYSLDLYVSPTCVNISTVSLPFQQWVSPYAAFSEDLQLTWRDPDCKGCEDRGGRCGFRSDTGFEIGCSNLRNHGLPRSAKYGIIIGVGIPGLLCIFGLACCICSRIRAHGQRRGRSTTTFTPQRAIFLTGLDGPTIESYPMTVLGESRRLPKPNDSTCPICLSEYQPKDTLRTIPECNHYFHANCIDEWLRLNATCPVCRNSPESSSVVTPCFSVSSPATSASSS